MEPPSLDPSTPLPPQRILHRRMFHLRQGERPRRPLLDPSTGSERAESPAPVFLISREWLEEGSGEELGQGVLAQVSVFLDGVGVDV